MKQFKSKASTALNILAAWIIHMLSYAMPRNRNIWIFIGWHQGPDREIFADNAKYMFLHASRLKSISAIWIGKDKKIVKLLHQEGLRAVHIHSIRGMWYSLRAGYTFIDAFMYPTNWKNSGGSSIIQLWHGKGMKKTGFDSPYSLQRYRKITSPHLFERPAKTIASSHYTAWLMASIFHLPQNRVLVTGLPRNDVLFHHIKGSEIDAPPGLKQSLEHIKEKSGKTILWAPTFRPSGASPLTYVKLAEFENALKKQNSHLYMSLHPKFARKETAWKTAYEHIHPVDAGYDMYPFLSLFDMLVTDYSSLYVDFLLLDKPIVFFTYDLEEYKKTMGLYDDFDSLTPGPHPRTFDELLKALGTNQDAYASKRSGVRAKLFAFTDGRASERIANIILERMRKK